MKARVASAQCRGGEPDVPQGFNKAGQWTAQGAGKGSTFAVMTSLVLIWAATGPIFGYSQTWQLVINTGTTIITFLMIFLVQNTQNRDTAALQLNLDELIRATRDARATLLDLGSLSQEDLQALQEGYQAIARRKRDETGEGLGAVDGREH